MRMYCLRASKGEEIKSSLLAAQIGFCPAAAFVIENILLHDAGAAAVLSKVILNHLVHKACFGGAAVFSFAVVVLMRIFSIQVSTGNAPM